MAGAAGCVAVTGAGEIVDESVEGVNVLRVEVGTRTAVEPNADTGMWVSVDAGAEPMFETGVVVGLAAVNRSAVRDDPAPSASCSLSTASLSE
jgi:hypothetical protein